MKYLLLTLVLCLSAAAQQHTNGGLVTEGPINFCPTDTGTANAYVCANPIVGAYNFGTEYCFNPTNTNTGASTLKLGSLSVITIRKWKAGSLVDLEANDIIATQQTCVRYDSTYMQLQGTAAGTTVLSAINPQTATYQVLTSDFTSYKTIVVASGTFTITLVAAASQPAAGYYINVVNYGSGTITINRSGQTINGGTGSISLAPGSPGATTGAKFTSDGLNYVAQTFGVPCTYDPTNGLQCGTGTTVQIFNGTSSGSQALTVDAAAGSGTWKLKSNAGTDYLLGEALTQTVTNKSIDSATNTLSIGGQALPTTGGTAGQRLVTDGSIYKNAGFKVTCTNMPSSSLSDSVITIQPFNTSCTIPANALAPGQSATFDLTYQITTPASPSAVIFTMQIDGTDVYKTSSVAQSANFTNRQQYGHFFIGTEVALGSTVNVEVGGAMALSGFAQSQSNNTLVQPITLNTTTSHTVTWTVQFAVANSTQSIVLRRVVANATF